jgi:hypothetical protein
MGSDPQAEDRGSEVVGTLHDVLLEARGDSSTHPTVLSCSFPDGQGDFHSAIQCFKNVTTIVSGWVLALLSGEGSRGGIPACDPSVPL